MSVVLATGSNRTGTLTLWNSDGTIKEICYYPAITNASFNTDWPGSLHRISCGSLIALLYIDTGRVQFVNPTTLAFVSMYQYDTSTNKYAMRVFAVGTETWVFWQDQAATNSVYLDRFNSSGALISTTTVDATNSVHYLQDVATWDGNTFYILGGQLEPTIFRWTVGDTSATLIRNIRSDMALTFGVSGGGDTQTICMHSPTVLVATSKNLGSTPASPNIGLFDMASSGAFIKRYLYTAFPQYPSPANESITTGTPYGVCSDGNRTLYTAANGGLHIWKIDTVTDAITIFNTDLQAYDTHTTTPTNPRYPTILYVDPVSPAGPFSAFTNHADGLVGLNVIDFAGKTFPYAHFDGLMDSTDFRFWPIVPPVVALPRLPDTSLTAEVRSEARLIPNIRMDGG